MAIMKQPVNEEFRKLMSNGIIYSVPKFQRDYSWDDGQWEDLWDDIENLASINEEHYMGYIVLQEYKDNKKAFYIIDGQQRFVTLSIIILAAMTKIKQLINQGIEKEYNEKNLEFYRESLIGDYNPVLSSVSNKIILNRNNHQKFNILCESLEKLPARGLTKTNRLLNQCFIFFSEKLDEKNISNTGSKIAEFITKITDSILFTKIIVDNELQAYKIFETLNARGVQLSTPDLLKNFLFSQIAKKNTDEQLDVIDRRWGQIIDDLGKENFTDFVRYHYHISNTLVTKKQLFNKITVAIKNTEDAVSYLKSLSEYAPIYAALNNVDDEMWKGKYQNIKHYLRGLKLFNIKQPFLLLLVAYPKFTSEEFIKLAKYIYIFSIRYNVISHYSPNKLDKLYNSLAIRINNKELKRANNIKQQQEFKKLYPSDTAFENIFKYHTMASRQSDKKIRFLLMEINNYLSDLPQSDATWTLEHVLPFIPTGEWIDYYGDNYLQDIDRLGNMVLLSDTDNKECRRLLFNDKKPIYQASNSILAQKVAEYNDWNSETLNSHQEWLAKKAVQTWNIAGI